MEEIYLKIQNLSKKKKKQNKQRVKIPRTTYIIINETIQGLSIQKKFIKNGPKLIEEEDCYLT